ncbi:MAG: 23S ribosomal RNA methyltransferase Erm [Caldilineaceae bacterium]|nr:23S ribosomal RNA methyltransferase Erm [Caldilineaceae bacterium]
MTNMPRKRLALAQNFFKSRRLVSALVAASSVGAQDLVYEIGPGGGIITQALARVAAQVVAIEKDPALVAQLQKKFQQTPNVTIVEQDFLLHHVRAQNYKVFANLPYNITAAVMRKLFYGANPPQAAYLVMQKEAAQKFAGVPGETQFSVLIKPWFALEITRTFARTDFVPMPQVDSVLLAIQQRSTPLVTIRAARAYRCFVQYGFRQWKMSLRASYRPIFTHRQWQKLARDLNFPLDVTPTKLNVTQWVGLFHCFCEYVPVEKQRLITMR